MKPMLVFIYTNDQLLWRIFIGQLNLLQQSVWCIFLLRKVKIEVGFNTAKVKSINVVTAHLWNSYVPLTQNAPLIFISPNINCQLFWVYGTILKSPVQIALIGRIYWDWRWGSFDNDSSKSYILWMHIGPLDIYYKYIVNLIHKQQVSMIFTRYRCFTYMIFQVTLEYTGNLN